MEAESVRSRRSQYSLAASSIRRKNMSMPVGEAGPGAEPISEEDELRM